MKCPYCGYENKEDAVFCTKCGKKLPVKETDEQELIRLAFAYTGNKSIAENIVAQNAKNIPAVQDACIAWIRSKEKLFDVKAAYTEGQPMLESFDDLEKQIVNMDYEERIVSLLHCYEKKDVREISLLLNISEEQVKGFLQNAYRKSNGLHVEPYFHVQREQKQSQKQEKKKEEPTLKDGVSSKIASAAKSKTAWKIEITVAVIAAVLLGGYFGIRSYAGTQYESGLDLYKSGNYAEASSALSKAVRFHGGGEEAVKYLGDAYYHNKEYDKAAEQYEKYLDSHASDKKTKQSLLDAYQKLADQALKKKDNETALSYLQKKYDLDNSTDTYIRMQAVKNGGTYTSDTNGTVYDTKARPVKISVTNSDSEELYTVKVSYKKNHVSSLTVTEKDQSVKIRDLADRGHATVSVFPDLSWQKENDVYEDDNLKERDYVSSNGNSSSIVYDNTLNKKGRITSRTFESNGIEVTDSFTWKNGRITKMNRKSADEDLVYTNTWKKGLLQKTVIKSGSVGEVGRIEYEYDASGNLTDQVESHDMLSADEKEPFMKNRHIAYTYTSEGTPVSCTIRTGDNELAGYGTYIDGTGWIMCYIQNEGEGQ